MKRALRILLFVVVGLLVVFALFSTAHLVVVKGQVEREGLEMPIFIPELETTTSLEILPLFEAEALNEDLEKGHGVSYLVRTDQASIILDLGMNPPDTVLPYFLRNFGTLKQDWETLDAIVISHPHPDHVGGNQAWQHDSFTLGDFRLPLSGITFYTPIPMTYPGATLVYAQEPALVAPDIATTGVLSYVEVFPLSLLEPKGHEQALVVRVEGEGLVVITGCGHPGLQRLVERAEALYREPVVGVVGGLHYGNASAADLQPEIEFLAERQPGLVALSPHDSLPAAIQTFADAFPQAYQEIKVGQAIQFP
jgi:7,8-dihydropterin-6-yl-methyl-4-(beta-D-ribofuranosyl)aminobenzene 5'-phosphate synthase